MAVPTNINAVTTEWLGGALDRPIRHYTSHSLGNGYLSDVYRIEYTTTEGQPGSLVLKLAASDASQRQVAIAFGSYQKEISFYREIAGEISISLPRCLFSQIDANGLPALGLEDLSAIPATSNLTGASLDQTLLAMATLARLHAPFWAKRMAATPDFHSGFDAAADYLANTNLDELDFPDTVAALLNRYRNDARAFLPGIMASPMVLSHMDFRLDNLRFSDDELVVLDWGEFSQAPPGFDLATFLTTSVTVENRRNWEDRALTEYLSCLSREGVIHYDSDTLLSSYRHCLLPMMYLPLLVRDSGRDPALAQCLADRLSAALLDHLPHL